MDKIMFGLLLAFMLCNYQSKAQGNLSARDSSYLSMLTSKLDLTLDQQEAICLEFETSATTIIALESKKKALNSSDLDEETLAIRLAVVNQEIKDQRDERNLNLQAYLDPVQLKIYQEKISPKKPQVLHFGIHNRADCKVCVK